MVPSPGPSLLPPYQEEKMEILLNGRNKSIRLLACNIFRFLRPWRGVPSLPYRPFVVILVCCRHTVFSQGKWPEWFSFHFFALELIISFCVLHSVCFCFMFVHSLLPSVSAPHHSPPFHTQLPLQPPTIAYELCVWLEYKVGYYLTANCIIWIFTLSGVAKNC